MLKKALIILPIIALAFGCAGASVALTNPMGEINLDASAVDVSEKPIPIERSLEGDYTYEGKLDPADFNIWSGERYQGGPYGEVFILQNPRESAAIKFAFVYISTDATIISFAYIEDDKLRYFGIVKGTHYEEIDLPENVRKEIKRNLLIMEEAFDKR